MHRCGDTWRKSIHGLPVYVPGQPAHGGPEWKDDWALQATAEHDAACLGKAGGRDYHRGPVYLSGPVQGYPSGGKSLSKQQADLL